MLRYTGIHITRNYYMGFYKYKKGLLNIDGSFTSISLSRSKRSKKED